MSPWLDRATRRPIAYCPLSCQWLDFIHFSINSPECLRPLVVANSFAPLGTEVWPATYRNLVRSHSNHAMDTAKGICTPNGLANASCVERVSLRCVPDRSLLSPAFMAANVPSSIRTRATLRGRAVRIRCSERFARSRPAAVVRMAGPFAQRSAHLAPASDGDFAPVCKDTSDLVTTRRTFVSTGLRTTFFRAKARCL